MTKLHQVIPAVDEVAKTAQNRLTEIHKLLSKEALTSGHHRSVKSRVVVRSRCVCAPYHVTWCPSYGEDNRAAIAAASEKEGNDDAR